MVNDRPRSVYLKWLDIGFPLALISILIALALVSARTGRTMLPSGTAVSQIGGWAVPLVLASFASGFVVMAIIQLIKPVLRADFHERAIKRWFGRDATPPQSPPDAASTEWSFDDFLKELQAGMLELPIEQLTAQIQIAVETRLAIGGPNDPMVRAVVIKHKPTSPADSKTSPSVNESAGTAKTETDTLAEKTKTSYLIQRRLDALQIDVKQRWRQLVRFLSLAGGLLLTSLVAGTLASPSDSVAYIFVVILLGLLAGFFASVARDTVAIIERLRL